MIYKIDEVHKNAYMIYILHHTRSHSDGKKKKGLSGGRLSEVSITHYKLSSEKNYIAAVYLQIFLLKEGSSYKNEGRRAIHFNSLIIAVKMHPELKIW